MASSPSGIVRAPTCFHKRSLALTTSGCKQKLHVCRAVPDSTQNSFQAFGDHGARQTEIDLLNGDILALMAGGSAGLVVWWSGGLVVFLSGEDFSSVGTKQL